MNWLREVHFSTTQDTLSNASASITLDLISVIKMIINLYRRNI